jgi:hypothetical protein
MRVAVIVSFMAAIVLLAACKESLSKYRVRTQYHIKKLKWSGREEVYDGKTDTFYYKPDGTRDNRGKDITYKTDSTGNTVTSYTLNKAGKVIASFVAFMNERGLKDSVVSKDSTHITMTHKYLYDSAGQLIGDIQWQSQFQSPNSVFKAKWLNGNKIENALYNDPQVDTVQRVNPVTGALEQVICKYENVFFHHEYFPDKAKMPSAENLGYKNGDTFGKNLEKKSVQLSAKGDTLDIYTFRYQFDDKNRVISAVEVNRDGNDYDSTAYTYY